MCSFSLLVLIKKEKDDFPHLPCLQCYLNGYIMNRRNLLHYILLPACPIFWNDYIKDLQMRTLLQGRKGRKYGLASGVREKAGCEEQKYTTVQKASLSFFAFLHSSLLHNLAPLVRHTSSMVWQLPPSFLSLFQILNSL